MPTSPHDATFLSQPVKLGRSKIGWLYQLRRCYQLAPGDGSSMVTVTIFFAYDLTKNGNLTILDPWKLIIWAIKKGFWWKLAIFIGFTIFHNGDSSIKIHMATFNGFWWKNHHPAPARWLDGYRCWPKKAPKRWRPGRKRHLGDIAMMIQKSMGNSIRHYKDNYNHVS